MGMNKDSKRTLVVGIASSLERSNLCSFQWKKTSSKYETKAKLHIAQKGLKYKSPTLQYGRFPNQTEIDKGHKHVVIFIK